MARGLNAPRELAALLGRSRVLAEPARLARYRRDFAGHDLGLPLAVALPASEAQVVALVRWARKRKTPLGPAGGLTSFWACPRLAGGVAVDLSGLARLAEVDAVERTARAGAGMSVAALDQALGSKGFTLAKAPDGFGTATLGSLVANDTAAGLGMFAGPASTQLVGLRAVLGTGEVLRAGASSALAGLPAFSRAGLPDLAGPLLASEGALGIVTELTLRVEPLGPGDTLELRLPSRPEAFERLVAAAQRLRAEPPCHTWIHHSWVSAQPDSLTVGLSASDPGELAGRRARVQAALAAAGLPPAAALGRAAPRWQAAPPDKAGWKGVSLQLPYAAVASVYRLWAGRLRPRIAPLAMPDGFLRTYLMRDGAAALLGWSHPSDPARAEASAALAAELRRLLAPLGIPYRVGTLWRGEVAGRLDPVYARMLRGLKALFDPDGILNPGAGVFP